MSTFKTIIEAEVLVAFPAAPSAITGDMTLRDLIRLILHLMHCSQAVKNDNHVLNYLYLACPDTFWANYSADAYPTTPAHPGNFRLSTPMQQQQTLRMGERHGNGS